MEREQSGAAADREDAAAALRGDGDAYARLVRRHQDEISRRMWRFTRDPVAHEELVQDVFIEAYRSLAGFRASAPFSHWLHVIAVRAGYAYWRDRARQPLPFEETDLARFAEPPSPGSEPPSPGSGSASGAAEAGDLVHRALARLPSRDRLVLTLQYLEGHTVAEISELTGWSRVMVKVQAWRARAKLKRLLAFEGEQ